jgi:hypothetical protein
MYVYIYIYIYIYTSSTKHRRVDSAYSKEISLLSSHAHPAVSLTLSRTIYISSTATILNVKLSTYL